MVQDTQLSLIAIQTGVPQPWKTTKNCSAHPWLTFLHSSCLSSHWHQTFGQFQWCSTVSSQLIKPWIMKKHLSGESDGFPSSFAAQTSWFSVVCKQPALPQGDYYRHLRGFWAGFGGTDGPVCKPRSQHPSKSSKWQTGEQGASGPDWVWRRSVRSSARKSGRHPLSLNGVQEVILDGFVQQFFFFLIGGGE